MIAIVTIGEPEKIKPVGDNLQGIKGKTWVYSQKASVKVEELISGDLPNNSVLYGGELFDCAQCKLSKGRFLVFLRKDKNLLVGTNWNLSLRPITKEGVEWFASNNEDGQWKYQKLETVTKHIKKHLVLKNAKSSS